MVKTLKMKSEPFHFLTDLTLCRRFAVCRMHVYIACCSLAAEVNGKTKAARRGPDGTVSISDGPCKEAALPCT